MGNDQSQFSGIEVQEKAIEVTDFWSHHSANINFGNFNRLSIFIGEPIVDGSLWLKQTPLERACKNLMIYRHPCILKYVSSWTKGSKFHLGVEDVKPLSHVLMSQSNLQICIGLYSILKALCFLHEKAAVSHNNICIASVYVSKDGSWKLGGMEYLCRFKDLTAEYLNKIKTFRYYKAIDPNEQKNLLIDCGRYDFIDIYGFSVLVNEVLKKKQEDIPALSAFIDLCKIDLQAADIGNRPKLHTLLQHPFFNHDFIQIHCFLTELPLKSDTEKNQFFSTLIDKLRNFDEHTVAEQLSSLLLSRMVLLNKTAQVAVVPFVLCPKEDVSSNGLFSPDTFKKCLIPKLLEIFCVRDAQIRQLLLDHFMHYVSCFSNEELQSRILPELLVGIKDTNDHLVAITLKALADLVPILGAATVIGGKRAKLFNDGRPIVHSTRRSTRRSSKKNHDIDNSSNATPSSSNITEISEPSTLLELPERPSPDGEEGETSTEEGEAEAEEDADNWMDWDINSESREFSNNTDLSAEFVNATTQERSTEDSDSSEQIETSMNNLNINGIKKLPNILELDIKNQKDAVKLEDFDFFQDMEPVIQPSKYVVDDLSDKRNQQGGSNKKFQVVETGQHEDGWGDDFDWD